jgi:hypothetical protein
MRNERREKREKREKKNLEKAKKLSQKGVPKQVEETEVVLSSDELKNMFKIKDCSVKLKRIELKNIEKFPRRSKTPKIVFAEPLKETPKAAVSAFNRKRGLTIDERNISQQNPKRMRSSLRLSIDGSMQHTSKAITSTKAAIVNPLPKIVPTKKPEPKPTSSNSLAIPKISAKDIIKLPSKEIRTTARKSTKTSAPALPGSNIINDNDTSSKNNNSVTNSVQDIKIEVKERPEGGVLESQMISIPTELLPKAANRNQTTSVTLINSLVTMRKIRPWLNSSDHRKKISVCDEMIKNGYCLSALFKCMAINCGFFTNRKTLFLHHLKLHYRNQPDDAENFNNCSYCEKQENIAENLIEHIIDQHGASSYQCAHCFYRCFDVHHASIHMKMYHADNANIFIKVTPLKELDGSEAIKQIWSKFREVCRMLICVGEFKISFFNKN